MYLAQLSAVRRAVTPIYKRKKKSNHFCATFFVLCQSLTRWHAAGAAAFVSKALADTRRLHGCSFKMRMCQVLQSAINSMQSASSDSLPSYSPPSCGSKREHASSLPPSDQPTCSTTLIIQTPHGLEHVAEKEIRRTFQLQIESIVPLPNTNGIIIVNVSAPPSPALAATIGHLACCDAAALFCGKVSGLSMDDAALDVLKAHALGVQWQMTWATEYVLLLPHPDKPQQQPFPTFRCTCLRTLQMADWGYNTPACAVEGGDHDASAPDVARIFARNGDAATSQMASHVRASRHCSGLFI